MKTYASSGISGTCAIPRFRTNTFCLPLLQDCSVPDEECKITPCGDSEDCQAVVQGDVLMIQTLFADQVNADPQNPVVGVGGGVITAQLLDENDVLLSGDYTLFTSNTCVGYDEDMTYQILSIDLALVSGFTIEKFKIRVTGSGGFVTTYCFQFAEGCDSFVLNSTWNGRDCYGYAYDTCIPFDNSMRIRGFIRDDGGSVSKTRIGSKVVEKILTCNYRLVLDHPISSCQKDKLLKQILGGDTIFLNGEEIRVDSLSVNNLLNKSDSLVFEIPFQFECNISGRCVN